MLKRKTLLTATAIAGAAALMASGVQAQEPYEKPDESNITITGEIAAIYGDSFTLDYGEGLITVEMDDWDFYNEVERLDTGDTVTVRGELDDEFYEAHTVEADSVYSYDRATYYYANDADEEDVDALVYSLPPIPPEGTWYRISGVVEDISGSEIIVDTGVADMTVDTAHLGYNPLDDVGFPQVDLGEYIYVSGMFDRNFFDTNEIEAETIITLNRDTTKIINPVGDEDQTAN